MNCTQVDPWISATLYCYALVTIVIITSSLLIIQLNRMKKKRRDMTGQQSDKARNENKITLIVLVTCVLFVVLIIPITILFALTSNVRMRVYLGSKIKLIRKIVVFFALSNHAINFLLYNVTSSNFREELKNLCGGMKVWQGTSHIEDTRMIEQTEIKHRRRSIRESVVSANHI